MPLPPSTPPVTPTELPPEPKAKTSSAAIVGLVLGFLGLCTGGLAGLVGIVVGIIAIVRIRRSAGRLGGQGLAIAAISVSAGSLVLGCLTLGIFLPTMSMARLGTRMAQNQRTIAQLAQLIPAVGAYADQNGDAFPPADDWVDALRDYTARIDQIVTAAPSRGGGRAYAMNAGLDGVRRSAVEVPRRTVLFFETDRAARCREAPASSPPSPAPTTATSSSSWTEPSATSPSTHRSTTTVRRNRWSSPTYGGNREVEGWKA